jgi:hypothetical protein
MGERDQAARHRTWPGPLHCISVPFEVCPYAPAGEQNAPGCTPDAIAGFLVVLCGAGFLGAGFFAAGLWVTGPAGGLSFGFFASLGGSVGAGAAETVGYASGLALTASPGVGESRTAAGWLAATGNGAADPLHPDSRTTAEQAASSEARSLMRTQWGLRGQTAGEPPGRYVSWPHPDEP